MDTRSPHKRKRGFFARLFGFIRWLFLVGGLSAAALAALAMYAVNRVDEEIRAYFETTISEHYGGLTVSLRSARRIDGKGIELRGLSISEGRGVELAYIDEILVACPAALQDLVSGRLTMGRVAVRRVAVRRLTIRATRRADGSWSAAQLFPLPRFGARTPPVAIEDATVEIVDPLAHPARSFALSGIHLTAVPEPPCDFAAPSPIAGHRPRMRVHGRLAGDHFRQMEFDGLFDLAKSLWTVQGEVQGFEISPQLHQLLPAGFADQLAPWASLRARTQLNFQITNQTNGDPPVRFVVSGTVSEGRVDHAALPYPLTDLQAELYCDNQGLRIDDLTARSGQATLRLSCHLGGFHENSPLVLRAKTRQLALDRSLVEVLPPDLRRAWRRFSPAGVINADLSLIFDGVRWKPDLYIECLDVSFAYDAFPYPVTGAVGPIHFKDRDLLINLKASAGGQFVHFDGHFQNLGEHFTGWIDVASEGAIPLDEPLLAALDAKSQALLRSLHPRGMLMFRGRLERLDPEAAMFRKRLEIELQNCSVKHERFPYPLDRIRGVLRMIDGNWIFDRLEGHNDNAYLLCNGVWTRDADGGSELALNFVGTDLSLEDELRRALNPSAQRLWMSLRPRGTIDHLTVGLRYSSARNELALDVQAQKWPPQQNVEGRSITFEPAWFPLRLDDVTGGIHYRDGVLDLKGVRAMHGRASVELDGRCDISHDGRWRVRLSRLRADRLQATHQLISALPARAAEALTKLNLTGPISLDGRVELAGGGQPAGPVASSWDLTLDIENGGLDCGVPLNHIHGGVRLVGHYDADGLRSRGELNIDSLICKDIQLTQVLGPFWIDTSQVVLGRRAEHGRTDRPPRQVTARTLGGELAADAQVWLTGDSRFELRCSLTDADLAQIARETVPKKGTFSGKAMAMVQLHGTTKGTHTWGGGGMVQLREADIYELPVMVALLKLLSIRRPDKTAFTTSDIDFRIQGEHVYFDRINFNGDAISLKGNGEMSLQRQLDLKFYTLVGRDELHVPILRPILGEASRQILLIQVGGTVDQPNVYKTPFPVLNETLQQLFPEAAKSHSSTSLLEMPRKAFQRSLFPRR